MGGEVGPGAGAAGGQQCVLPGEGRRGWGEAEVVLEELALEVAGLPDQHELAIIARRRVEPPGVEAFGAGHLHPRQEGGPLAVEIAQLPEHIRGYHLVKDEQLEEVQKRREELLTAFRQDVPGSPS